MHGVKLEIRKNHVFSITLCIYKDLMWFTLEY